MFKNIERKQRFIDDKQRVMQKIQVEKKDKEKQKQGYYKPEQYSIDLFNR